MRCAWLLLALAAFAAGGCGQKGPLYLPDKGGKVVTSAPAPPQSAPAPAPIAPAAAPPAETAPEAPAAPKPTDKDKNQEQDTQPPK